MNRNVGTVDKIVRLVLAVVLGALLLTGQVSGIAAIIVGIAAVLLAVTALIGFCPLYALLGISTKKEEKREEKK